MILQEITEEWLRVLGPLQSAYPFSERVVVRGHYGILVLSRHRFVTAEIVRPGPIALPSVAVQLQLAGRPVTIVGTHPWSPLSPHKTWLRNSHLSELARWVQSQPTPLIVLGDLNTTSWSPIFKELLRVSGLRDSRRGFGVQPTWPAPLPRWLRLPLDHCLVSSEVQVHTRRVGPWVGSDHHPVIIEVSLAVAEPTPDA